MEVYKLNSGKFIKANVKDMALRFIAIIIFTTVIILVSYFKDKEAIEWSSSGIAISVCIVVMFFFKKKGLSYYLISTTAPSFFYYFLSSNVSALKMEVLFANNICIDIISPNAMQPYTIFMAHLHPSMLASSAAIEAIKMKIVRNNFHFGIYLSPKY